MNQALKDKVIAETKACLVRAEQKFGVDLGTVDIRFDIRSKRIVGWAEWSNMGTGHYRTMIKGTGKIRFHPEAIATALTDTLTDTIPHEVAHLVCAANPNLGRNHDRGWKHVCRVLGGLGERCSKTNALAHLQDDAETKKAKRMNRMPYLYVDAKGCEQRVSKPHHTRLQSGRYGYLTVRATGARIWASGFVRMDTVNHLQALRAKNTPAKKAVTKKAVTKGKKVSKIEKAKQVVDAFYGKVDKDDLIKQMMFGADLTEKMAKHYLRCILKNRGTN